MTEAHLPPDDDARLQADDALAPEHPAGSDAPVSAGEALSAEGIGTGAAAAPPSGTSGQEPDDSNLLGDDS